MTPFNDRTPERDAPGDDAEQARLAHELDAALVRHARFGEELAQLKRRVARLPPEGEAPAGEFLSRLGAGLPPGVEHHTLVPVAALGLAPEPAPSAPRPETRAAFDPSLLNQLSESELDGLPYGVIVLDGRGRIVAYNDTESRMAGLPRDAVLGRQFFGEVAPCARVKAFEGRFQDVVQGRSKLGVETFEFIFHFAKGAQRVLIMISQGRTRGTYNISLIRR
jgi:photoactive yellow protein